MDKRDIAMVKAMIELRELEDLIDENGDNMSWKVRDWLEERMQHLKTTYPEIAEDKQ